MPTYGYHCDNCGTEFDVVQRMIDESKADCPSCGSAARRLFYPAGIVFKGGGFYKTDSRSSSSTSSTSNPSKPAETKSDTKTDAPKTDGSGSTGDVKTSSTESTTKPSPAE